MLKFTPKTGFLTIVTLGTILAGANAISAKNSALLHLYNDIHPSHRAHIMPGSDLARLDKVMTYIKQYYYKPVTNKTLFDNAISGMLSKLDPHSDYLHGQDLKDLEMMTMGKFGGIGIEVMPDNGALKIVSPLDDTPASKAGIKAGDLIIQIDNQLVKDMTLREAVTKMRGPKGSTIKLILLRKNAAKPITLNLTRETIKIQTIKSKTLAPGYGYIRIAFFQEDTASDLDKAIIKLKKANPQGLKGLIIDLRNDPGGLLEAAIKVSDDFLDAQKLTKNKYIVYTKGQFSGSEIYAKATNGEKLPGTPIIVMINDGSASASEIVAGALQDHKRALVIGTRSFGKGSVQTLLPLNAQSAIKITTALYYTPLGRSIQALGIEPNIVVNNIQLPKLKDADIDDGIRIDESNLADHIKIKRKSGQSLQQQLLNEQKQQEKELTLAHKDYQLHEALNILKGVSAYNN